MCQTVSLNIFYSINSNDIQHTYIVNIQRIRTKAVKQFRSRSGPTLLQKLSALRDKELTDCSDSVKELKDLKLKGGYVKDSSRALCCVLEQDTWSSALYWFNPGRQENVPKWLKNCWLGWKASTKKIYHALTLCLPAANFDVFANNWTQIRANRMSGLIWIKAVWLTASVAERIFWKS